MRHDVQVMQIFVDEMVGQPRFSFPSRQKNAPRPDSFAHITMLEEYQIGLPTNSILDQPDDSITIYRSQSAVKLRYRIGVINHESAASRVMNGWTSERMKELMMKHGYGFVRCTPLSNEDALLEKEWEPRRGFSVELYTERDYRQTVNNIDQASVGGEYFFGYDLIDLGEFKINLK